MCKPQISGFHLCLRESRSSYHPSRQQRSDLTSVFALFVWTESACGHCGLTWLELLREHNVSQLYGFLGLIFSSWSINPAADPALDILMESIKGYQYNFFLCILSSLFCVRFWKKTDVRHFRHCQWLDYHLLSTKLYTRGWKLPFQFEITFTRSLHLIPKNN